MTVSNQPSVQIQHLVKRFEDIVAVNDLTLSIENNELFGFLGPNGAGKTTTLNILCGLLKPTSGSARVGGYDAVEGAKQVKHLIGVCPQEPAYYPHLTGRENVELFGNLHLVPKKELKRRVDELLVQLGMEDSQHRKAGKYSGGMVRRVNLAMALVNDPDIAFLDEPTVAMDPQARRAVWDFIRDLKRRGKTIILTTHYMEEAEALADRVGIIDHGELIALGTPAGLKAKHGAKNLEEVFIELTGRKIREGA